MAKLPVPPAPPATVIPPAPTVMFWLVALEILAERLVPDAAP
jgi:hypothetical protein